MALLLISHDLGVIAQNVARMLVMYGGSVVESGPTAAVFARMAHPYTQGLFAARPKLGAAPGTRLVTIAGTVPELVDLPRAARSPTLPDRDRRLPRIAAGGRSDQGTRRAGAAPPH
jgi:oligopeptide/dipeptide ABC transporter ATP-binding protein